MHPAEDRQPGLCTILRHDIFRQADENAGGQLFTQRQTSPHFQKKVLELFGKFFFLSVFLSVPVFFLAHSLQALKRDDINLIEKKNHSSRLF